ncbi:MAG: UDP-N-acetylmuramoyl-tripeptide--D-alanyl-D-alanine ligase [bacterium]
MKKLFRTTVLAWLKLFAKLKLQATKPEIIGLTGSAGKTSLMYATKAVLSSQYRVNYTAKANSESGIPLHILGLQMTNYSVFDWLRVCFLAPIQWLFYNKPAQKYIMELGIDKPGDMAYLLTIVQPRVAAVLNIGSVHAEAFSHTKDPIKAIAEEKSVLVQAIPQNGCVILNYDDPLVRAMAEKTTARTIFCSLLSHPDHLLSSQQGWLWADSISTTEKGFSLTIHWQERSYPITLEGIAVGKQFAYTILEAFGIAISQHVPLHQAASALKKFHLPPGRASIIPGIKDTTILDSSYNASKEAVISMLEVLESFPQKEKIAILGDMRELGTLAEKEHRAIARKAVNVANTIITVGPMMRDYFVDEAQSLDFDPTHLHYFINPYEAARFVKDKVLKGGEVILVKGSQNTIYLEIIVKAIMQHPELAGKLLCRQEAMWERKRGKMEIL